MEIKTSTSYQKEVLEQYCKEKGEELSTYLLKPTPRLIKQACVLLLEKRSSTGDRHILNCFFQFTSEDKRLKEIQDFDNDRFRPIVNFLKGKVQTTSAENIELISWLIDFQPRPLQEYLSVKNSSTNFRISGNRLGKGEKGTSLITTSSARENLTELSVGETKKPRNKWLVLIFSVFFSVGLMVFGIQKWAAHSHVNTLVTEKCMTWADSLYLTVSCDESPLSKYGTQVKPLDQMQLKNMRQVAVDAAYKFFSTTDAPLIWYYKKSNKEIEYFTAPGLHPTNGETLRKITPYIIQTYVPKHKIRKGSLVP